MTIGLTDKQRTDLYRELNRNIVKYSNYSPTAIKGITFKLVKPTIVAEIKYLDLLEESRGYPVRQDCLKFNRSNHEWEFVEEREFPTLISPEFSENPIRKDKNPEIIRDVRIQQITDLINVIPHK